MISRRKLFAWLGIAPVAAAFPSSISRSYTFEIEPKYTLSSSDGLLPSLAQVDEEIMRRAMMRDPRWCHIIKHTPKQNGLNMRFSASLNPEDRPYHGSNEQNVLHDLRWEKEGTTWRVGLTELKPALSYWDHPRRFREYFRELIVGDHVEQFLPTHDGLWRRSAGVDTFSSPGSLWSEIVDATVEDLINRRIIPERDRFLPMIYKPPTSMVETMWWALFEGWRPRWPSQGILEAM